MSENGDLNEDNSNIPEAIELVRDSENTRRNTVSEFGEYRNYNKNLNRTQNIHIEIAKNLRADSQEEMDENNDADPEELVQRDPDEMNKTIGDVFIQQIFGKKNPNEKPIPFDSKKAKFIERLIHPIQWGSLRSSIFGLSSMCLEAGALVLAIRCKQFGMVNFLVALALGGLCAYWTLLMMIKAGKTTEERDYSKVVKEILGNKVRIYVDCNITVYLLGAVISFQVIIYQILGSVIYDIMKILDKIDNNKYDTFEKFKEEYWRKKYIIKLPVMFGVAALVFPLCLLKDVSKMRFASLIGVLALIYSIIVILIESPFYLKKNNWDLISQMNWFDIRKAFSIDDGIPFFGGVATVFYIYSCHAGAFPVFKTLKNNTTRRIKKVFRRSILLDIMVYTLVAAASFITCPLDPPELILYRENLKGFDPDYFIIIAKIGIIFNLFFSTPANYAGLRISLFELLFGNSNITTTKNIIVTLVIFSIVVLTGALYDEILEYIELLGGFCSVIYCFFIPGLIYVKSNDLPKTAIINILTFSVLVILLIIGYTSGILTILFNMVKIRG
jgi:amino acid permease